MEFYSFFVVWKKVIFNFIYIFDHEFSGLLQKLDSGVK